MDNSAPMGHCFGITRLCQVTRLCRVIPRDGISIDTKHHHGVQRRKISVVFFLDYYFFALLLLYVT